MIVNANSLEHLKTLDENSVDSVVTDPPYGLSFMGKKWDYDVPSSELWAEALRVLKPGGHLLAFAGTRTQHRMAVNIEDAGFEIRDMIAWVYGSGFPKSHNIGKAVDKINGETGRELKFVDWYRTTGMKQKQTNEIIEKTDVGSHYLRRDQPAIPTVELWAKLRPHIEIAIPEWVDELVDRVEAEREITGKHEAPAKSIYTQGKDSLSKDVNITKGNSGYDGWGTALKPALEPITVARKPISEKTIAKNVLEWGTGGINIDGSRVEYQDTGEDPRLGGKGSWKPKRVPDGHTFSPKAKELETSPTGRFPANLIHDGSDEVVGLLGEPARFFYTAKASKSERNKGLEGITSEKQGARPNSADPTGKFPDHDHRTTGGNNHPTVKPVKLMQYLVKLVTPVGGTVLDPFNGSGTTGIACKLEGFDYIGVELDEEYCKLSEARIDAWEQEETPEQLRLA